RHSAIRLQGNGAWTDLWASFTQFAQEMALKTVQLDINAPALHEMFNARWVNPCEEDAEEGVTSWHVAIPLVWGEQTVGRLDASGSRDEQPVWMKVAMLTKLVDDLELALWKIADDIGLPAPAPAPVRPPLPAGLPLLDLNLTK